MDWSSHAGAAAIRMKNSLAYFYFLKSRYQKIANEVATKKRFGTPDERQSFSLVKDEVSGDAQISLVLQDISRVIAKGS